MKKVFALHDKYTEEIIGYVIVDNTQEEQLWEAWKVYHNEHNSNSTDPADINDFEARFGNSVGFEYIEVDFIQLSQ